MVNHKEILIATPFLDLSNQSTKWLWINIFVVFNNKLYIYLPIKNSLDGELLGTTNQVFLNDLQSISCTKASSPNGAWKEVQPKHIIIII